MQVYCSLDEIQLGVGLEIGREDGWTAQHASLVFSIECARAVWMIAMAGRQVLSSICMVCVFFFRGLRGIGDITTPPPLLGRYRETWPSGTAYKAVHSIT